MSRWPTASLEELIVSNRTITYGVVKPGENPPDGIKLIRGGDILAGRIYIDSLRTITRELSNQYRRTILRGGELLVSLVGNPGEVALVPKELVGANLARQAGLIPLGADVVAKYVMYFLMSHWGRAALGAETIGAVQKVINLADLKRVRIPLPPKAEQHRIASILSTYDDLIENNTRRIAILEEMARRIYEEWFVRFRFPGHENVRMVESELGLVPEGWTIQGLYEVAELTYGFPFKSKQFDDSSDGVGVVRIRDIKNDRASTFTAEPADAKYRIVDGDILVGMDGTFHMGRWAGGSAWLNQRVVRFRPKKSIPRSWLFWVTEGPIKHLEATIVGTTVAHLSARDLKEMKLVVPTGDVMRRAAQALEPLFDLELVLKKKNASLRTTRDLLLPKLISGELDVSAMPEPEAAAA